MNQGVIRKLSEQECEQQKLTSLMYDRWLDQNAEAICMPSTEHANETSLTQWPQLPS